MLKWTALLFVAILFVSQANAQDAPSPQAPSQFVPIVIAESDYKQFQRWLEEQPMKFALPVAQWLDAQARKAVSDKMAADKAKADKPPSGN